MLLLLLLLLLLRQEATVGKADSDRHGDAHLDQSRCMFLVPQHRS